MMPFVLKLSIYWINDNTYPALQGQKDSNTVFFVESIIMLIVAAVSSVLW